MKGNSKAFNEHQNQLTHLSVTRFGSLLLQARYVCCYHISEIIESINLNLELFSQSVSVKEKPVVLILLYII
jgi:hypothetical protein